MSTLIMTFSDTVPAEHRPWLGNFILERTVHIPGVSQFIVSYSSHVPSGSVDITDINVGQYAMWRCRIHARTALAALHQRMGSDIIDTTGVVKRVGMAILPAGTSIVCPACGGSERGRPCGFCNGYGEIFSA